MGLGKDDQEEQVVPFNWVNSNIGGAVVDGEFWEYAKFKYSFPEC